MEKHHHGGHRERLRQKVSKFGVEILESHEVLELLLFYALPRRDTNEIAHELLSRFDSLEGVMTAPVKKLAEAPGVSEKTASFLHFLYAALSRMNREDESESKIVLRDISMWKYYCMKICSENPFSRVFLLLLDPSLTLLSTEVLSLDNDVLSVASRRSLLKTALAVQASSAILVRSVPDCRVSQLCSGDLMLIADVYRSLAAVQVSLFDYVIVGADVSVFDLRMTSYTHLLSEK